MTRTIPIRVRCICIYWHISIMCADVLRATDQWTYWSRKNKLNRFCSVFQEYIPLIKMAFPFIFSLFQFYFGFYATFSLNWRQFKRFIIQPLRIKTAITSVVSATITIAPIQTMVMQILNGVFGNSFHGHIFNPNKIDGVSVSRSVCVCTMVWLFVRGFFLLVLHSFYSLFFGFFSFSMCM